MSAAAEALADLRLCAAEVEGEVRRRLAAWALSPDHPSIVLARNHLRRSVEQGCARRHPSLMAMENAQARMEAELPVLARVLKHSTFALRAAKRCAAEAASVHGLAEPTRRRLEELAGRQAAAESLALADHLERARLRSRAPDPPPCSRNLTPHGPPARAHGVGLTRARQRARWPVGSLTT